MNALILEPGQDVLVQTGDNQYVKVPYETVIQAERRLRQTKKAKPGVRFSRVVALVERAVTQGMWSTGRKIAPDRAIATLAETFHDLDTKDYSDITSAALFSLQSLKNSNKLTADHKETLAHVAQTIESAGGK
jgi:hypothetical protein